MPASLAITRPSHSIVRTRSNFWGLYQSRAQIALKGGGGLATCSRSSGAAACAASGWQQPAPVR